MFESRSRLEEEIRGLIEALRRDAGGRYACLVGPKGLVFETPPPEDRESWALRGLVEERSAALFELPARMESGGEIEDVFAGWEHDELFLAVLNRKVALVLACPEAEPLRESTKKPLAALCDRLLRYDETWRMDARGRGFFFGRPRLDLIVVGRAERTA